MISTGRNNVKGYRNLFASLRQTEFLQVSQAFSTSPTQAPFVVNAKCRKNSNYMKTSKKF